MPKYAQRTSVSTDKSKREIEKILERYGATAFRYSSKPGLAMVEFTAEDRWIRFTLPLPRREEFALTETGRERAEHLAAKAWEQACRQRWRALCLSLKAKLEAVECGIAEFEDEFLGYVVDPTSGKTVREVIRPQLTRLYQGEKRQPLLLEGPTG